MKLLRAEYRNKISRYRHFVQSPLTKRKRLRNDTISPGSKTDQRDKLAGTI